jgi:hypothetical protein
MRVYACVCLYNYKNMFISLAKTCYSIKLICLATFNLRYFLISQKKLILIRIHKKKFQYLQK